MVRVIYIGVVQLETLKYSVIAISEVLLTIESSVISGKKIKFYFYSNIIVFFAHKKLGFYNKIWYIDYTSISRLLCNQSGQIRT
jgi:hypothetical protein